MFTSPLRFLRPRLAVRPLTSTWLAAGAASLLACSAPDSKQTDDAEATDPGDGDASMGIDDKGNECSADSGPGVIRRLTAAEYRKSLDALFGAGYPDAAPLTGNTVEGGYTTNAAGLWVRDLTAQAIESHATAIGQWVATTDPSMVTTCTELTEACATETIRAFGRQAFRMPPTDEQVSRHQAAFMAGDTFEEALGMLIATMLQSPYFLYRRELGQGEGAAVALSDYELGSSLSYFLTDLPPDAELGRTIDAGTLRTETEWNTQVERLLNSPEAEQKLVEFVIQWLDLEEVLTRTKTEDGFEVPDPLRASMLGEVEVLVRHVIQNEGGVADLLDNESIFINGQLAQHYEISGPTTDTFELVPAGERAGGLLGTGAYLLSHSTVDSSSPTLRGLFIRERLLCQEVTPPPPSVDTDLPPITGTLTTRQRYAEHLTNPTCANCHEEIDTLGFAFEGFDGLGRHRIEENGMPVDTSGVSVGLHSGEVPFSGPHELTALLSSSAQVDSCFHQNLAEFILGQTSWDNLCSPNAAMSRAQETGGSLKDSLRAILALPHIEERLAQEVL